MPRLRPLPSTNTDPTRHAKRLQLLLRQLKKVDDQAEITLADAALLDRGLAALIDAYASGKEQRAFMKRVEQQR